MNIYSLTYHQLPLIKAPKIHTDLLWDLSFLFIGLAMVYFIFVFFYRNRLSKLSWQVKERKKELSPMVSEFLFYDDEASKDEKSNYINLKIEIRQLLKDDFNRKVLSEVLLDLRKDVAGETQKRLFKLYKDLGLHNEDFGKLKSWRWQIVSKGILNLTQMQVDEAYSFVTKFINDKRATIRKQAEIAVVTLKSEGINHFLDTTKYKISEWQQLKLLDVLRNDKDYQPPRFKAWLTSTNRHVVLFALRLMKYYNQNDADAALIELVKHKNDQIKEEAIGCIKEFHIVGALPTLKLVFWKSSTDVKISILDAIGVLGEEDDIEFLELIENKEANFSVRSKAHSSINVIAPDSIMPSKGLVNTANYSIPKDLVNVAQESEQEDQIEIEASSKDTNVEEISKDTLESPTEEVKPNAVLESQEIPKPEIVELSNEEVNSEVNYILNIDFLPVVVEEVLETEKIKPEEQAKNDLIDMVVNFEEVTFEKAEPLKKEKSTLEITDEEIAFLPIVTEMIKESYQVNSIEDQSEHIAKLNKIEVRFEEVLNAVKEVSTRLPIDYSEYNTAKILDTTVIYDEILELKNENQTNKYFLSVSPESSQEDTMDAKSKVNNEPLQSYKEMESQEEQNFKKIIKNLIGFKTNESSKEKGKEKDKENKDWPLLEFGDEFVDTSKTSEVASEEITNEQENDNDEEVKEIPSVARLTIPKAILNEDILDEIIAYKENTEESRMRLLDDLEEMGDERELPLLHELLVNEKFTTVKDRVKRLIDKFSEGEERPEIDSLLKPFNVFEDLFRTCDTEAKLILMDEIVGVGDESDIGFLEGLLEHEDQRISTKAAQVLDELKAILSIPVENIETEVVSVQKTSSNTGVLEEEASAEYNSIMEELQIQPPKASEIFDLTFELTEPEEEKTEANLSKKDSSQESILGQICAFSSKIIDKLNG